MRFFPVCKLFGHVFDYWEYWEKNVLKLVLACEERGDASLSIYILFVFMDAGSLGLCFLYVYIILLIEYVL